jgi:hypothetical protein
MMVDGGNACYALPAVMRLALKLEANSRVVGVGYSEYRKDMTWALHSEL